jgi:DNA-binding MarR family transcriptional regulator
MDTITEQEAKRVGQSCVCLSVQQAARVVGRMFDDALRPLEITNWQFSLLMVVAGLDRPSITALASQLSTDRTTITANLKPLERRGLVAVGRDEADARARRVHLTPAGGRLAKSAFEIWKGVNREATRKLDGLGLDEFRRALAALAG